MERGAHARFVGERAGGRGLREQGVAACALGAECVDARLGRAARVMDRAAVREVAYAWRGVGDGGNRCGAWGSSLCGNPSRGLLWNRLLAMGAFDWGGVLLILILAGLHGRGSPQRHKKEQRRGDHYAKQAAPVQ